VESSEQPPNPVLDSRNSTCYDKGHRHPKGEKRRGENHEARSVKRRGKGPSAKAGGLLLSQAPKRTDANQQKLVLDTWNMV
jgi:hypothetical protein